MAVTELARPLEDRVSNALKWVLLGIAIVTFGILGWATSVTYRTAPPEPKGSSPPTGPC